MDTHFSVKDTIVACGTPPGIGAISMIRISGEQAIHLTNKLFRKYGRGDLLQQNGHTLHIGKIYHKGECLDEVVIALYRQPHSFTGEDLVEIMCHGSPYIVNKIIKSLIDIGGTPATPGAFTQRAFLNGRIDLTQAEAVADLIHAKHQASHRTALKQLKGGISQMIKGFRKKLIEFTGLLELELDFMEEDVEFLNRTSLNLLLGNLAKEIKKLVENFRQGNALRNGVATAIIGSPNVGKSTLLNALLNDEKAIVSPIPGTTRDVVDGIWYLGGVQLRLIDTAGLRTTSDEIEQMGIERTKLWIERADLVLYLVDLTECTKESIKSMIRKLNLEKRQYLIVGNKCDEASPIFCKWCQEEGVIVISAKTREHLDLLELKIKMKVEKIYDKIDGDIMLNARHYEAFSRVLQAIERSIEGLNNKIGNELVAAELRIALCALGEVTGEISTNDLLNTIFGQFCIGK